MVLKSFSSRKYREIFQKIILNARNEFFNLFLVNNNYSKFGCKKVIRLALNYIATP